MFHIISAHDFPQSLKCEAVLQLFNSEAKFVREHWLSILLLWNQKELKIC